MKENPSITTTLAVSEQASSSSRGLFLSPLEQMMRSDRARRRHPSRFIETPPWMLFFKNAYYSRSRDFLQMTLCTMLALESLPTYPSFNLETGVVTKHFVEYLRSVDPNKAVRFATAFRSYLTGERKRMPGNISPDVGAYETLRQAACSDYTRRLIGEWKGGSVTRTQDFVVLFKMPLSSLLETVFGSMTDEDVIQAIEQYRA